MKKIYTLALISLAVLSCQEDAITPAIPSGEMSFNILAPGVQTKATAEGFEAEDVIGLYAVDYADATTPMPLQISGNRANNLQVTFDGSLWTPAKTIYWGSGKTDVYAYYPYMSEISEIDNQYVEVATDQTLEGDDENLGAYEASDILWAKASGVSQTDGAVSLAMQHVMSKLTVKIVAGEDYVGSLPDDATVHLHSTVAAGRLNLENGSVTKDPYSGAESIKMKKLGLRTYDGVEAVVYEAIVIPQMIETPVPLFEINSKSVSYLIEDYFNFRPGTAYTYTITLNTSTTAIKVEIGCELEDWNSTSGSGDSGEGGESGDGSGEDVDLALYTDLSAPGTANCYMVSQAGDYRFKSVIGNSDATVGNVKSVEVLWESFGTDVMPNVGDLIASVSYSNGYVCFSTPEEYQKGNAVIAAKNSQGTILWSWHIWMTDQPEGQVYYNNAGTMMDRNLGATSATPGDVGALGLIYQWGRKDPFLGSSSISESVEALSTGEWLIESDGSLYKAETNPMIFYAWLSLPDGTWDSKKTVYDPCPAGWRVPDGGDDGVWAKALGSHDDFWDDSLCVEAGLNFSGRLGASEIIYYPFSGCRPGGYEELCEVGSSGYYWSVTPFSIDAYYMYISNYEGNVVSKNSRARGYAVRCLKEESEGDVPGLEVIATDLSASGTANSYIVSESGVYKFPTVKGNSSESVGLVDKAEVLWESFGTDVTPSVGDLVKNVSYSDGSVIFETPATFNEGNAVIAAKDASGTILWSWHIWLTDEPEEQTYYNNAGTMMDRNLGATSATPGDVGALGLLYQWGRKDPFLSSSSISSDITAASTIDWPSATELTSSVGIIDYITANPTTFVTSTPDDYDWCYIGSSSTGDALWQSEKTIYDPCPAGWHVPKGGENGVWAIASGDTYLLSLKGQSSTCGNDFSSTLGPDASIWYPAAGQRYTNGDLSSGKVYGYYWTSTISGARPQKMSFESNYVTFASIERPLYGYTVRCVKDSNGEDNSGSVNPSEPETANSYIVSAPGTYTFKAVRGNSTDPVGQIASVEVLWESFGTDVAPTVGDLIISVSHSDGYITYQTAQTYKEGNAVIAAKNKYGNILWSWHIWFTEEPETQEYAKGSMMDRNLGAISAVPGDPGALGLLYQWGRKDPFLGSSSITASTIAESTISWPSPKVLSTYNTLDYTISYPTTYLTCSQSLDLDIRNNISWQNEKTICDPCPVGWRVIDKDSGGWLSEDLSGTSYDSTNQGISILLSNSDTAWYPATGMMTKNGLGDVASAAFYWVVYSSDYPSGLQFNSDNYVGSMTDHYQTGACPVRCIKDE